MDVAASRRQTPTHSGSRRRRSSVSHLGSQVQQFQEPDRQRQSGAHEIAEFIAGRVHQENVGLVGHWRGETEVGAEQYGQDKGFQRQTQALRDADGANLDRVQVVKGWVDQDGETHERVFDIAVSDGRAIDESFAKRAWAWMDEGDAAEALPSRVRYVANDA